MNMTVGLWMAVGVLGIAAAYGNVSYFNQQTKYALMEQRLRTMKATDLAENGNEDIKRILIEKNKIEEDYAEIKNTGVVQLMEEVRETKSNLDREQSMLRERDAEIVNLTATVKEKTDESSKHEEAARVNLAAKVRVDDLDTQLKNREKQLTELQVEVDTAKRDKDGLKTNNENLLKSAKDRIMVLQGELAKAQQTVSQKSEAARRRSNEGQNEDVDGQILTLDINSKFCVVDVGSVNNARRGMRFEVVRRKADKWEKLATIELTKINASTSEAIIIDLPAEYKECPSTGYKTDDLDQQFSPYVAGRENRAVPLRKVSRGDISSMRPENPVLVGDVLRNPLFNRDKKLKFAFAGEPVVFSEDILKNRIMASGNFLQEVIDLETDFLILGKTIDADTNNDDAENEINKAAEKVRKTKEFAEQYGIPIMREVELNQFLRQ